MIAVEDVTSGAIGKNFGIAILAFVTSSRASEFAISLILNKRAMINGLSQQRLFMRGIRDFLAGAIADADLKRVFLNHSQHQHFWAIAIVLYQSKMDRLMVVRRHAEPKQALLDAVHACRRHNRFHAFEVRDSQLCTLQIDYIIHSPESFDLLQANDSSLDPNARFEVGVDGLRISHEKKVRYFLPGDGYVKSVLGMSQLRTRILRLVPETKDLSSIRFERFRSRSYLDQRESVSFCYRGLPTDERLMQPCFQSAIHRAQFSDRPEAPKSGATAPPIPYLPPSAQSMLAAAEASIRWLLEHQRNDGAFLYYYDAFSDGTQDHEHPRRPPADPYYNLLRHCGAVITIILYYQLAKFAKRAREGAPGSGDTLQTLFAREFLPLGQIEKAAKLGCEFFCEQLVSYKTPSGEDAAYPLYNRKAKLGGAGLGLYMLALFADEIDTAFDIERARISKHLVGSIMPTGEFRYYHVYLDKLVSQADNVQHFSFYYPGEAIIGLATQFSGSRQMPQEIQDATRSALRYLVHERPRVHSKHYQSLPSDGWLMMAINKLRDNQHLQDDDFRSFVFGDADQMVAHQYHEGNAVFPDYVGSFFYNYGDHPYPDAARAEGLLGAYEIAVKCEEWNRAYHYRQGIDRVAWATLRLCNHPDSVYAARAPEKSLGGIRFKFTRQWFRIDTIQHVASFYLKLLQFDARTEIAMLNQSAELVSPPHGVASGNMRLAPAALCFPAPRNLPPIVFTSIVDAQPPVHAMAVSRTLVRSLANSIDGAREQAGGGQPGSDWQFATVVDCWDANSLKLLQSEFVVKSDESRRLRLWLSVLHNPGESSYIPGESLQTALSSLQVLVDEFAARQRCSRESVVIALALLHSWQIKL